MHHELRGVIVAIGVLQPCGGLGDQSLSDAGAAAQEEMGTQEQDRMLDLPVCGRLLPATLLPLSLA